MTDFSAAARSAATRALGTAAFDLEHGRDRALGPRTALAGADN